MEAGKYIQMHPGTCSNSVFIKDKTWLNSHRYTQNSLEEKQFSPRQISSPSSKALKIPEEALERKLKAFFFFSNVSKTTYFSLALFSESAELF